MTTAVLFCYIALFSTYAWGQAAAEYALGASKSAASTSAVGSKLNRALGSVANRIQQPSGSTTNHKTPRQSEASAAQHGSASASITQKPALAISVLGGNVATEDAGRDKYARVVEIGSATRPSSGDTKPDKPQTEVLPPTSDRSRK